MRLNTNESPLPPPAGVARGASAPGSAAIDFNRYPDREATDAPPRSGREPRGRPEQVFCANGSNEVLQSPAAGLRRARAGRWPCSSRPTPCTGTSPGPPAPRWPPGAGPTTSPPRPRRGAAGRRRPSSRSSPSSARPTTPPAGPTPCDQMAAVLALAPGLVVVDEAYGQFAPSSALELLRPADRGRQRVVVVRTFSKTWSMAGDAPRLPGGRPRGRRAPVSWWRCPTTSTRPSSWPGAWPSRYVDEMEARVALLSEERGRIAAGLADLPVETWPSDANFILFRPAAVPARKVWSAPPRPFGARARLFGVARARPGACG